MKITKISELRPSYLIEPTYKDFIQRLETLSNELGVAVATCGGIVMFDSERDRVRYERDPCSGNLEPVIEEISSNKTAATAPFDFKKFSTELREMSDRYKINLVSLGALSGTDAGGDGVTYLAIWRSGDGEDQGN